MFGIFLILITLFVSLMRVNIRLDEILGKLK